MFNSIKNIANNLTWWARKGAIPTGIKDPAVKEALGAINHFSSSKFTLCIIAVIIIVLGFLFATTMLFFLPKESYTSFVTIHHDFYVVLALIISVMLGASGLVTISNNNSSSVSTSALSEILTSKEEKMETLNENINIKEERIEHVYREGEDDAPMRRPFSKINNSED